MACKKKGKSKGGKGKREELNSKWSHLLAPGSNTPGMF